MRSTIVFTVLAALLFAENAAANSIVWNISATTSKSNKKILSEVLGTSESGRLHALLGPSGSGKSTLLNSVAGTIPKGSMTIIGDVQLSEPMESIYIEQEDALFAQLTTLETLQTSAELRTNLSPEERARDINNLINDLGLKKVKNTKVGDTKTRGLSGGEKKRLSIANELIDKKAENALIFADEPTSGLDCFQAEKVVNLLKKLADQNNVVLFSIHQPRSSIYAMFDDITILSEGKVIYTGSREEMLPYFESIGHPCPSYANPAEYYVDLVSLDLTSPEEETSSRERIDKLAETFASKYAEKFNKAITSLGSKAISMNDNSNSKLVAQKIKPKTNPFKNILSTVANSWRKLRILHQRAWRQITRDKPLNIARFASSMFSALLFGAIYFRMGTGAATVPDRLGLLQVAAVNTAMTSLIKATTSFVTEKVIVNKERQRGAYSVIPYFLSKLIAEIPLSSIYPCLSGIVMYKLCGLNPAPGKLMSFISILVVESMAATALGMSVGSLVPTVESGIAVAPSVMVIFIVFGGLYVVNTPNYLSWVPKISLIRWAYEALCVNEFSGLELQPDKSTVLEAVGKGSYPGQRVLERMGMGQSTIGKAIKAQLAIVAFNYVFTIISLMRQSSSTEQVHNKQKNVEGTSDKAAVVAERESKENLKAMKMFNKNGL